MGLLHRLTRDPRPADVTRAGAQPSASAELESETHHIHHFPGEPAAAQATGLAQPQGIFYDLGLDGYKRSPSFAEVML